MADPDLTAEAHVLRKLPRLRQSVLDSEDFHAWRSSLPCLNVDGEVLYVRGGDMLCDEEQIIFEWARRVDLLTDTTIASALATRKP